MDHFNGRDYWLRLNDLEELNYKQASMLMERDFQIHCLTHPSRDESTRNAFFKVVDTWRNKVNKLEEELSTMKKQQEEKDNRDNVIDFSEAKLALASKEPPEGGNWLSTLSLETRFLAYRKGTTNPFLEDFLVGTNPKEIPAVLLGFEVAPSTYGFKWCDPVKFSREYSFYMTIKAHKDDGIEVQAGRVDSDGETQGVHPVHEKE